MYYLQTIFFLTHHMCTTRYSWVQANSRRDLFHRHRVSLHQMKRNKENFLGGQAGQLHSACSLRQGMLSRKKKVRTSTRLLHCFVQSWGRQPTSFLLLRFFQGFTDGNETCGLHEGKVLEQLSEKNITDVEKAGSTLLFLEGLTHSWVPISGEEGVLSGYPAYSASP